MSDEPEISVLVASYNSRQTIPACLEALRRQRTSRRFEVIVIDSSDDGTGDLVAERFPEVRLIRFAERKFPGDARNAGIAAARASIVASVDADCEAREDWVEEILEAHREPVAVIGGPVANASRASYVGCAAYLCEFSDWMPGSSRRWIANMPTANISYKKKLFSEHGQFIEGTYGSDTDFHWRLRDAGHRLLWLPSVVVSHHCIDHLRRYIVHEFGHGRDCARMRIASRGFPRWRRWLYAVCFFLIPVKLYAVIVGRCLRNRTYLWDLVKTTPLVAAGLGSWSFGELIAYLRPKTRRFAS
jgi:GT2 family glycosyltransferase